MAETEGFEPSVEFDPHTGLAIQHHRPLGHVSLFITLWLFVNSTLDLLFVSVFYIHHMIDVIFIYK